MNKAKTFIHKLLQLPGYTRFVPKGNGWLNLGIGGKTEEMKKKGKSIRNYWQTFTKKLQNCGLVTDHTFNTKGYTYYLHDRHNIVRQENAFIIGDAAGLVTIDMREGIGSIIKSGLLAARAIHEDKPYCVSSLPRYSLKSIVFRK